MPKAPNKPPGKKSGGAARAGGPGGGRRVASQSLRAARKHKPSSQRWLTRQLNDPYVQAAQAAGWRSRAAFKLQELDEKFRLLQPGQLVVDLGAAPGSWTQYAAKKIGTKGQSKIVGIDLLPLEPLPPAIFLQGDFTEPKLQQELQALLGGPAHLILSDMAPNTIGHAKTDHLRIMALAEQAHAWARDWLRPGGHFVCKLFQGGTTGSLHQQLLQDFAKVHYAKPAASRSDSSELYLVALNCRRQR